MDDDQLQHHDKGIDEQNALRDASNAIADYLFTYGDSTAQFMEFVGWAVDERLAELADEAAKEQALNWKADELGYKY